MTGHLRIGDTPMLEMSDEALLTWMKDARRRHWLEDHMLPPKYSLREETALRWLHILRVFDECNTPMTVRQVFYQMEVRGYTPKTEQGYTQVAKALVAMRRAGIIPYRFIADHTRWVRKPDSYSSLQAGLEASQETYRRDLWEHQSDRVEIWIEKEALMGVIDGITAKYDVPLYPCKGYPSHSFLYAAAESIKDDDKPTFIYYFGDHDPSGKDIPRAIQETLEEFGAEFTFEIVAVTPEQIDVLNLPTRPTKRTDSRSKNWRGGESVELDAIPPDYLRGMVKQCIVQHINLAAYEMLRRIEAAEKETLAAMIKQLGTSTQFGTAQGGGST
jgi:hypothetical protein